MNQHKWPNQVKPGDVLISPKGDEFDIVKVVPHPFGWVDIFLKGYPNDPVTFGQREKVEVKG